MPTSNNRPWTVHIAGVRDKSFVHQDRAVSYALLTAIGRGLGTRVLVRNLETKQAISLLRNLPHHVSIYFSHWHVDLPD